VKAGRQIHAFTLAEALAALLLAAIVLPAAVGAILTAGRATTMARRTEVASQLAANRLQELVVTGEWETSETTGDFGDEWPGYRWELTVEDWAQDDDTETSMTQLTITAFTAVQGREISTSASTLEVLVE